MVVGLGSKSKFKKQVLSCDPTPPQITIPDPVPRVKIVPTNIFAKTVQGRISESHVSNIKQNKITPTPDYSTVTMSRNPSLQLNEYNAVTTPIGKISSGL